MSLLYRFLSWSWVLPLKIFLNCTHFFPCVFIICQSRRSSSMVHSALIAITSRKFLYLSLICFFVYTKYSIICTWKKSLNLLPLKFLNLVEMFDQSLCLLGPPKALPRQPLIPPFAHFRAFLKKSFCDFFPALIILY